MKGALDLLRRERLWPALVLVLAVGILLPGLSSFGFWEPHEIDIADRVRAQVEAPVSAAAAEEADQPGADKPAAAKKPPASSAADAARPPLNERAIGWGVRTIGVSEAGARLPLALLGVLAVLATFLLGLRLGNGRVGLLSALVLVTFPLFLFQARQLMSSIGAVAGSAVLMLGLVGLCWPRGERDAPAALRAGMAAIDVVLVGLGALLSYYAAAALLGLVVPFTAIGLASLVTVAAGRRLPAEPSAVASAQALIAPDRRSRWHITVGGIACVAVALAALALVLSAIYDMRDPVPGTRQLLGKSFIPTEEPSRLLGGVWPARDRMDATVDTLFEQIAYGLFPWIVLAPIAVGRLAMGPRVGHRAWAGYVVFAWAFLAWLVATVLARKVGPVHYPALVAIALAIGMWLDDLFTARRHATEDREDPPAIRRKLGMPVQLPLVAFFVFLAAITLGKDLQAFPEQLANIHILDGGPKYPADLGLKKGLLVLGAVFSMLLAAGLWLWRLPDPSASAWQTLRYWPLRVGPQVLVLVGGLIVAYKLRSIPFVIIGALGGLIAAAGIELLMRSVRGMRPRRTAGVRSPWYYPGQWGVSAALGFGVVFALFVTQVWTPRLSQAHSSKHLFAVYRDLRAAGDELVILGNLGSGPDWYAGTEYEAVANRAALVTALKRPARVFGVVPAGELCALHRQAGSDAALQYFVHDDSHSSMLLLSNRLDSGHTDRNPLARAIRREPPTDIQYPTNINFDDKIELIGYNIPSRVAAGRKFEMTLFYKVLAPVGGSWKVIVHIDRGSMRINGDHDPIGGRCSTSYWQPGDYIVDTFTVTAGDPFSFQRGPYRVWTGFFVGSGGNFRNMKVVSGERDNTDRVPLGTIQLQ